jgi:hypothetical protein
VPGRNSREAIESYAESICQTLRCITRSVIGFGVGVSPSGSVGSLNFLPDPIAPLCRTKLGLLFSQGYVCTQDSHGDQLWKVQTRSYFYTVFDCRDEEPCEIFSYQWHPESRITIPHVHFKKGDPTITRAHLPTGRIAIELIVEFLIQDLGVVSPIKKWEAVIARNRELPERYGSRV